MITEKSTPLGVPRGGPMQLLKGGTWYMSGTSGDEDDKVAR